MLLTAFALAAAAPPIEAVAAAPRPIRDAGMTGDLYLAARAGRAPAILLLRPEAER